MQKNLSNSGYAAAASALDQYYRDQDALRRAALACVAGTVEFVREESNDTDLNGSLGDLVLGMYHDAASRQDVVASGYVDRRGKPICLAVCSENSTQATYLDRLLTAEQLKQVKINIRASLEAAPQIGGPK